MPPIIDQTRPDQTVDYELLYDKDNEQFIRHFYASHLVRKKMSFRVIDNCYLLPYGGIFDDYENYVEGSNFIDDGRRFEYKGKTLSAIAEENNIDISNVVNEHSTVVYLGVMAGGWGHFITDSMRFMWFQKTEDYIKNFSECPFVYYSFQNFKPNGNYKRMLDILGINVSVMQCVETLTKYDRIILPDESFFHTSDGIRFFTPEYVETINIVRDYAIKNMKPVKSKKLYYSYSGYTSGKSVGEDKLEKYFSSKGYEIIHPEKLSLDEQLNLLVNCESFASTVGSCSHNMIFLRDDTEVILIPRANYMMGYEAALDHVHNLKISYVDSSFSIFVGKKAPHGGPFLFFISSNLRKYFHDKDINHIISASDFRKYLRIASGHSLGLAFGKIGEADNPEVYRYYSKVAAEYFSQIFKSSWLHRLRKFLKKLFGRK
ncbi:MAG: glycosyltransferase family 61 protein [Synergistaceae bacterium]|nr:glycosyltransferase family 61 protein [Synergistaceae bacterium]